MFDVAVLSKMGCGGVIQLGENQAIHWIAFAEVWVRPVAELAIAAGWSVLAFALQFAMKEIHDDLFLLARGFRMF